MPDPTKEQIEKFEAKLVEKAKEVFGDTMTVRGRDGKETTVKTEDYYKQPGKPEAKFADFVERAAQVTGTADGRAAEAVAELRADGREKGIKIPSLGEAVDTYVKANSKDPKLTAAVKKAETVEDKIKVLEGAGVAGPVVDYIKRENSFTKAEAKADEGPAVPLDPKAKAFNDKVDKAAKDSFSPAEAEKVTKAKTPEDKLKAFEDLAKAHKDDSLGGRYAATAKELRDEATKEGVLGKAGGAPAPEKPAKPLTPKEKAFADKADKYARDTFSEDEAKTVAAEKTVEGKLKALEKLVEAHKDDSLGGRYRSEVEGLRAEAKKDGLVAAISGADRDTMLAAISGLTQFEGREGATANRGLDNTPPSTGRGVV